MTRFTNPGHRGGFSHRRGENPFPSRHLGRAQSPGPPANGTPRSGRPSPPTRDARGSHQEQEEGGQGRQHRTELGQGQGQRQRHSRGAARSRGSRDAEAAVSPPRRTVPPAQASGPGRCAGPELQPQRTAVPPWRRLSSKSRRRGPCDPRAVSDRVRSSRAAGPRRFGDVARRGRGFSSASRWCGVNR